MRFFRSEAPTYCDSLAVVTSALRFLRSPAPSHCDSLALVLRFLRIPIAVLSQFHCGSLAIPCDSFAARVPNHMHTRILGLGYNGLITMVLMYCNEGSPPGDHTPNRPPEQGTPDTSTRPNRQQTYPEVERSTRNTKSALHPAHRLRSLSEAPDQFLTDCPPRLSYD